MNLEARLSRLDMDALKFRASAASTAHAAALKEIEVRFATSLLDTALPKGKSHFGSGLAGSIARENLVNRVAQILVESGALNPRTDAARVAAIARLNPSREPPGVMPNKDKLE